MAKLLVIDNYDSFTYNLVQMFMEYALLIELRRSDKITLDAVSAFNPDYILVSPGPKDPSHAGVSMDLIRTYYRKIPILGICLGMQCINEVFGGTTVRAPVPVHGKTNKIYHNGLGIFRNVPTPLTAARYHSLMANPASNTIITTAESPDGVIMGQSHPEFPLHGVQFHPESFLTEHGDMMIKNFLNLGTLNV